MWDKFISFINALIIHALLLALIFFNLDWSSQPHLLATPAPENIIQAVAMDESQVLTAMNRFKIEQQREEKIQRAQFHKLDQQIKHIQRTVTKETKKLDKLQQQTKTEQQQLTALKKRHWEAENTLEQLKRQKAEQARLKQEAEERKKIAAAQRQAEEEQKQQQLQAEEQRLRAQEAAQRLAQQKAQKAEQRRQLAEQERLAREAEAQRQAAEQVARLAKEKEAAAKQALEHKIRQEEQKQRIAEVILKIKRKVQSQWIRPRGYYRGLSCMVEILLNSDGSVIQVIVVESSGNIVFDNSAEMAVRKASPLPVPTDVFDTFRHFQFTFTP